MTEPTSPSKSTLVDSGIAGLDDILYGGLTPRSLYLVEGNPGSGKTTLGLQYLLAGRARGERGLYVTLSESPEELHGSAAGHGWSLEGIDVLELASGNEQLKGDARYTMFHPSEVELTETTRGLLERAEKIRPPRLVFDSLSELRLLAQNPLRFRRQILAFKQFFARQDCTVLLLDDKSDEGADMHLYSIAHGVISLERYAPDYGPLRRRLQIPKLRGRQFREGYHDFRIRQGGLEVFPRLVAAEHSTSYPREAVNSGLAALDAMLGGGLARGTSTLVLGPAGTGKSSLATQYARAAALRGDRAAIFLFDEAIATFKERSAGLGMALDPLLNDGRLSLRQVNPAELSPGELYHVVRQAVDRDQVRLVVIDNLNGYLNAMPQEKLLTIHLHEMLSYLGHRGVTTILIMAQHGLVGAEPSAPIDTSYLADTVILLRFFEAAGEVRQAISVIKKRTGPHERTIRELSFHKNGLTVGEPLREFQGVLTGAPTLVREGPATKKAER